MRWAPAPDATSTLPVVNPQLFYPMAGLRYVFNTKPAPPLVGFTFGG